MALCEEVHGKNSIQFGECQFYLGTFYEATDKRQESNAQYEKALEITQKKFGRESVQVAKILKKMAKEAIKILNKIKSERFLELGAKNTLKGISERYAKQEVGQKIKDLFKKSEQLAKYCLETCREYLGDYNTSTAVYMNSLANVYYNIGENLAEFEELYQESLKIVIALRGPDDGSVAASHNNIGGFYSGRQDYKKSE
jgi:tetratricopeptide (TPR) repeat protein